MSEICYQFFLALAFVQMVWMHNKKGKEAGFVKHPIVRSSSLKHSGMDHTVFTLQLHHTCLYFVKHSPDGAATDSDNSHLIAAYYSLSTPRG